jgi:hypothetical protein
MAEEFAAFGSREYFLFLACMAVGRALDFLSTWVATPNLVLEANPIARKMGWRVGITINIVLCVAFALWPLPAVVITTTSVLVAARNFQWAWLMRSMGELSYRVWMGEQLAQGGRGLFAFCLGAQTVLYGALGGILVYFSEWRLIPFGIGVGIITFGAAVFIYSMVSVWRIAGPRL